MASVGDTPGEPRRSRAAPHLGQADLVAAFDALLDPYVLLQAVRDDAGRVVDFVYAHANPAACDYNRMPRERLVGMRLLDLLPGHLGSGLLEMYAAVIDGGPPLVLDDYSYDVELRGGTPRRFDIRGVRIGMTDVMSYTWRDVTERHDLVAARARAEAAVASERLTRLSLDNAVVGMAITAVDGRFLQVNDAMCRMLGYDREALQALGFRDVTHPDDLACSLTALAQLIDGPASSFSQRKRYLTARGETVWVDLHVAAVRDGHGDLLHFVAQMVDINAEVLNSLSLERSERLLRLALDGAPHGMAIAGADGVVTRVNPALERLLGLPSEQIVGRRITEFLAADGAVPVEGHAVRHEHRLIGAGRQPWVEHAAAPMRDADGRILLVVHQFSDRTETRRYQERLAHQAAHDDLTGLANRSSLMVHLQGRLLAADAPDPAPEPLGILFCDLDNLKTINDTRGHLVGDAALTATAERIRACVRSQDVVARVGGDEFVVLLEHARDARILRLVADKVRTAAEQSLSVEGDEVPVTLSVGGTLAGPGEDPDAALGRADRALYVAKSDGRNRVAILVPEQSGSAEDGTSSPEAPR